MSAHPHPHRVVAIDGPAASGKSTVARQVAARLGFLYVNSGAMYRAFTWLAVTRGIDCADREAVKKLIAATEIDCGQSEGVATIRLNGQLVGGEQINLPEVNANVSPIAAVPEVRARLLGALRAYADRADVVMEGRDIGSVVFPATPHKFYIDASPAVRQARRQSQGLEDSIADRDRRDSTRETAPLTIAEDAVVIDSSDRGIEEVVTAVLSRLAADGVK